MEFMAEAEILMQGEEYQVDSREIIKIIDSSKCSAYDCEFIALAQNLDVPLITSDKQIINEFPETAISIESYGKVPNNRLKLTAHLAKIVSARSLT